MTSAETRGASRRAADGTGDVPRFTRRGGRDDGCSRTRRRAARSVAGQPDDIHMRAGAGQRLSDPWQRLPAIHQHLKRAPRPVPSLNPGGWLIPGSPRGDPGGFVCPQARFARPATSSAACVEA
jgi:hypothetical protein